MGEPTVANTSSRALVSACVRLGLSAEALLEAASLSASDLEDPDGRLSVKSVGALWTAALEQSGDEQLGLHTALLVPFGAYRVIDFLAASSPTVGEGLVRVSRYFPIINASLRWDVKSDESGLTMTLGHAGQPSALPRAYAEYALAVTILHCRQASGFDWPLEKVSFAFPAPISDVRHREVFGCPVSFAGANNEFTISAATRDTATRAPSTELLSTLEAHAAELVKRLGGSVEFSALVSRRIMEHLEQGNASLANIARALGMSQRTLQRRLEQENTTFADVLDHTRQKFAEAYMKEKDLALTEIAYLLGFSEPSAFTRAFQRWHGVPPSQFRALRQTG